MRHVFRFVLLGVLFGAAPAQASSWLECEGSAIVRAAAQDEEGVWQLSAAVDAATVTSGYGAAGSACGEAAGDVMISSKTEAEIGQTVRFIYRYYGGLGPQGTVTSRTWERGE